MAKKDANSPQRTQTDPAVWAERINSAWRVSVGSIFETGRLLAEAMVALPYGEFIAMVRRDLPFDEDTAQRLMAIARDQWLDEHVRHLPPSWGTLLPTVPALAHAVAQQLLEAADIVIAATNALARLQRPLVQDRKLLDAIRQIEQALGKLRSNVEAAEPRSDH